MYFRSTNDVFKSSSPAGLYSVSSIKNIVREVDDISAPPTTFIITTELNDGMTRELILATESELEFDQWVFVLQQYSRCGEIGINFGMQICVKSISM